MGIEKTEIKKAAYTDVGLQIEKLRDAQEIQVAEHRGAARALKELMKQIVAAGGAENTEKDLHRYMKKLEAREAELAEAESREPGTVSMGVIDIIKFGIEICMRAARQAESAAVSEKNKELIASGSLQSYEATIQAIKKQVDVAQAQIDKSLLTDEDGDAEHSPGSEVERPTGVRPASLKSQRLAEDSPEKGLEEDSVGEDAPTNPGKVSPVKEPAPAPAPATPKKPVIPKAVSPTAITEDVGVVAAKKPKKKAAKKRKGRLGKAFKGNGVRTSDA
jgi:hypothetical protein